VEKYAFLNGLLIFISVQILTYFIFGLNVWNNYALYIAEFKTELKTKLQFQNKLCIVHGQLG